MDNNKKIQRLLELVGNGSVLNADISPTFTDVIYAELLLNGGFNLSQIASKLRLCSHFAVWFHTQPVEYIAWLVLVKQRKMRHLS
jgi:hypothetical protein